MQQQSATTNIIYNKLLRRPLLNNNKQHQLILHWTPPDIYISTIVINSMMMATSSFVHDTDKRIPLRSRPPPPPSTPSLTKQILTMVSSSGNHNLHTTMNEFSNNMNADGDGSANNHLPPSPTDSVTQAMKTDLEELIGYIDGLAFDKMSEGTATTATPPSTNKQRFSTTDTHPFDPFGSSDNGERVYNNHKSKDDVLRDRTNRFSAEDNNKDKNNTPQNKLQLKAGKQQSKILDPSGSPPTRDEPAGSPPCREGSLYFHDESLSLILSISKSEDGDDEIGEEDIMGPVAGGAGATATRTTASSTPRLLSTFQKSGIIVPSPDRAKTISFLTVSKDATPSKSKQSSQLVLEGNDNAAIENDDDEERKFDYSRKYLVIRKGTPYPHYRRIRIEEKAAKEDNNEEDRIGSKYESSIQQLQTTPARRAISFLPVPIDDGTSVEENEHKTVTMTTPMTTSGDRDNNCELEMDSTTNSTYFNRKGTPYPFRRRDYSSNDTANDNVNNNIKGTYIGTPIPQQQRNEQSKVVLTSPESAKKLLQTAVDALKDARQERESARQWAKDIKDSVNQWVKEQRQLIRTESQSAASVSGDSPVSTEFIQQHHQAIEDSINDLRHEINHKISSRSETENHLHMLMAKQDEQIRELSNQLIVMKEQLACIVKEGGVVTRVTLGSQRNADPTTSQSDYKANSSRFNKDEAPSIVHKTPESNRIALSRNVSHSETSAVSSHGSHRIKRTTPSGGHLIDYGNGTSKEVHPDGTTVTRFRNGDVETRFGATKNVTCSSPSSSCVVAYYHSKEEVLQITQKDGSVLYEYSSGQVERHCADGVKIILFPDGTKTIV